MSRLTVNEFPQGGFSDEIVIKVSDFKSTTAVAETITYPVAASTAVLACGVKTVTPFDGGSLTGVNLDVGQGAYPQAYLDSVDIGGGGDPAEYSNGEFLNGDTRNFDFFSTVGGTINIKVTPTGDGLANATEGKIKISFSLVRLD